MKVALLGGGGFRTPSVVEAMVAVSADVPIDELVLHDVDGARLARIRTVVEGLDRERGDGIPVRTTTSLDDALEGASFVLCAIRVGGLAGRLVDEEVPLAHGVVGQETVGPGGICFALRTAPVMLEIARTVADRAPAAWFLNFTNPAGLVTEVVRTEIGGRAIGICDTPRSLCAGVAAAMGRVPAELRFDYAGLNHLGWLTGVHDDGRDLLPSLLEDEPRLAAIEEAGLFGTGELRARRMIPNEYLVFYERPEAIVAATRTRGSRARILLEQQASFYDETDPDPERALDSWRRATQRRHTSYLAEARRPWPTTAGSFGEPGPGPPAEFGYAAVATDVMRGVAGTSVGETILEVGNAGTLDWLDDDAVVEVPCTVGRAGPAAAGRPISLPAEQRELMARIKEVERLTIRAALGDSAELAVRALALHPLVGSEELATRMFGDYLDGHPALAARFA